MLLRHTPLRQCNKHFKNIYINYKHPEATAFRCIKEFEIIEKYKHKVLHIKTQIKV